MKKKWIATLLTAVMTVSLLGCGGEASDKAAATDGAAAADSGKPYVAMIALGFSHQYWQAVKQGAEQAAEEYGVSITFEGPETETQVDKQVDMLKTALGNNPVAVCMAAIDTESVAGILQEAKGKGVKVVGFDAGVGEAEADCKCTTDSIEAGAIAAEHAAELIGGKGKVAVIGYSQTTIDSVERNKGFIDKITNDYPDIEVVDVQFGDGDHLKSAEIAKAMVQANPDLNLIFSNNEGSCIGAYNGLNEVGKINDVKLIGFDSSAAMKEAIRNGQIAGAITQDPIGMGYKSIEAAVKLVNGEEVESFIDTGCYWYDADNMDDPQIAPLLYD